MPTYVYAILDDEGNRTEETFEGFQKMSDEPLTEEPETGRPCQRIITGVNVAHSGPAWDWCESTKRYINTMKPKYIRDDKTGVRRKYPKGGV